MQRITDGMFLEAARALAGCLAESDLEETALFPRLAHIRDISHAVACAVIRRAVAEGQAEPEQAEDVEKRVRAAMWKPEYRPFVYQP